jgi:hypothetical protein
MMSVDGAETDVASIFLASPRERTHRNAKQTEFKLGNLHGKILTFVQRGQTHAELP